MTFHGKPRCDEKTYDHVHESPAIMLLPLFVLSIGAVGAGYVFYDMFVGEGRVEFWAATLFVREGNDVIEAAHHVPLWVKKAPLVAAVSGIVLATFIYGFGGGIARLFASSFKPFYVLIYNKYFIDEIYDVVFQRPTIALGRIFFQKGDQAIINKYGPDGLSKLSQKSAGVLSHLQSGFVYHYAFMMMIGLIFAVSWIFWKMVF
jgi:NADH-quinone oxidoreductase subunit L